MLTAVSDARVARAVLGAEVVIVGYEWLRKGVNKDGVSLTQ